MLQNIKKLYGLRLAASDGEIGHVKDFYFDDETWVVRYLVADTGSWLLGRQVLLSPHAFGGVDRERKSFAVNLTRQQIEGSPPIEQHQPVSRQYEIDYYQYYGWPAYWSGDSLWGLGGFPVILPPPKEQMPSRQNRPREDGHLRSTRAVTGYAIHATDGEIGSVSGFLVDEKSWAISQVAVETGHWYSGHEIAISTATIERISYESSEVFVKLTKAEIRHAAELEKVEAGA